MSPGPGRADVPTALHLFDRGRFDAALALLDRCAMSGVVRPDLVATLRASALRQQGRHRLAQPLDAAAADSPVAWVADLARLGLVADRVGQADLAGARTRLAACRAAEDLGPVRQWGFDPVSVRRWVEVEVALMGDLAPAAVRAAQLAVRRGRDWPSDAPRRAHHLGKSLLFLAVSQRVAGDPGALATARECLGLVLGAGLAPLIAPARSEVAAGGGGLGGTAASS